MHHRDPVLAVLDVHDPIAAEVLRIHWRRADGRIRLANEAQGEDARKAAYAPVQAANTLVQRCKAELAAADVPGVRHDEQANRRYQAAVHALHAAKREASTALSAYRARHEVP